MNETPKTETGWRILRRILIGLAILATLIAIFYAEEDWRGKRAWENCKRELEAKGAVLDWNKYIPPPVPDDQNFFMASTKIASVSSKSRNDAEADAQTGDGSIGTDRKPIPSPCLTPPMPGRSSWQPSPSYRPAAPPLNPAEQARLELNDPAARREAGQ